MSILIVVSGGWATLFGVNLPVPFTNYELGRTYVGEVVAFTAFGVAWMVSGKDLQSVRRFGELIRGAIKTIRPNP